MEDRELFEECSSERMLANVGLLISGKNIRLECNAASAYNVDKGTGNSVPAHYEIQCYHYNEPHRVSCRNVDMVRIDSRPSMEK